MKKLQKDYLERVYAGVLGKTIGVRHGSNDEGWSYEKIKETFGEIKDYLFTFKNFASDDDTNGTFLLPRALADYECSENITSEQIADTLLNYAPDHHGFFWWGPYGVSTECTAYTNLKAGAHPPLSGSAELNGPTIAEQIGGQIFIDGWGLVAPAEEQLAARLAERAACVTHGGNGVYGGMFIAAAVSAAFDAKDIYETLQRALAVIPQDCTYARMVRDIWRFWEENPDNWRDCLWYIRDNYWQDKFPGNCHIMPNSAMMMLSMLYGKGSFSDTINICNMCGWDTDCNVANVGTILAVLGGLDGIEWKWREPIGDFIAFSSVLGDVNIDNLAQVAYGLAAIGYRLHGEELPEQLARMTERETMRFDFSLPGSLQAFRVKAGEQDAVRLMQSEECFRSGSGALKILAATDAKSAPVKVYYQTYYHPDDFNDSRYDPSFSPVAYPGQTFTAVLRANKAVQARLYWKDDRTEAYHYGESVMLSSGAWMELRMKIPAGEALVHEVGVELLTSDYALTAYLDEFAVFGDPDYRMDFAHERIEHWNNLHEEISQCMYNVGSWTLEKGALVGHGAQLAEIFTGSTRWQNVHVKTALQPVTGKGHNLEFRVQGAMRCYAVGLAAENKLVLYKKNGQYEKLAETDLSWKNGCEYTLEATAVGNAITVSVDGEIALRYVDKDEPYLYGSVGLSSFGPASCQWRFIEVAPAEKEEK